MANKSRKINNLFGGILELFGINLILHPNLHIHRLIQPILPELAHQTTGNNIPLHPLALFINLELLNKILIIGIHFRPPIFIGRQVNINDTQLMNFHAIDLIQP